MSLLGSIKETKNYSQLLFNFYKAFCEKSKEYFSLPPLQEKEIKNLVKNSIKFLRKTLGRNLPEENKIDYISKEFAKLIIEKLKLTEKVNRRKRLEKFLKEHYNCSSDSYKALEELLIVDIKNILSNSHRGSQ